MPLTWLWLADFFYSRHCTSMHKLPLGYVPTKPSLIPAERPPCPPPLQACYELYAQSPTGLAWDEVHVNPENGSFTPSPTQRGYLQRPEVLESIFYMHRLTGAGQASGKARMHV